jgi:Holliday junction resolvase
MTFAKKTDVIQKDVVKKLRSMGATVVDLSAVGKGMTDLLVGFDGQTILLEVKSGADKKFTPQQIKFFATWTGGMLARVNSVQEAEDLIQSIKQNP